MYITIDSFSQFHGAFCNYGRQDQFSYDGLQALFEYYNDLDDYELDVVGICVEWTEYESVADAMEAYEGIRSREEFDEHTTCIDLPDGGLLLIDF